MDMVRIFFNFSFFRKKSQSQQKLAKKINHFTISFAQKHSFYEPQPQCSRNSQKPFSLYNFSEHVSVWCQKKHLQKLCNTFSWRPRTAFLKHFERKYILDIQIYKYICILLYISSKKSSFQWSCKSLSCGEGGWMAGGWIIFLKADRSLGLVKCYTIFHFNWNFWKFNYFLHFGNFNLSPPLFYSLNFTKKL